MIVLELMITGWSSKYNQIIREFGYKKQDDLKAALTLDSILQRPFLISELKKMLYGKPVLVIGAGPSLKSSIPVIKKYKDTIKICADTALTHMIKNRIRPEIVVTDLDGDLALLKKISKTSVVVVHAHGDNIQQLAMARDFRNCIGTTQTEKVGRVYNFGGFTDGDRCVFLASHFGASKIFLFGMDFGTKIGKYSNTKESERKIKLKKLKCGKMLLEWFAPKSKSELFILSSKIKGFKKITYQELEHNIRSWNAF